MPVVHRLPAYLLNGIAVALGISIIQLLVAATAGPQAGALAMSGAVCASLADVPNTVHRTAQRVPAAALLGWLTALVVALLQAQPVALGLAVPVIVFIAMMTMAWGARAGCGVVRAHPGSRLHDGHATGRGAHWPTLAMWHAAGAVTCCRLVAAGRQRAAATLSHAALCEALRATAALLRARAACWLFRRQAADADALRGLDRRARPFWPSACRRTRLRLAAPDSARARRDSAILLLAIDLRDVLLASRLDLELLGGDADARWLLARAAEGLNADRLAARCRAAALRSRARLLRRRMTMPIAGSNTRRCAADDDRARLLPLIVSRLRRLAADAARIHALLRGRARGSATVARTAAPLRRAEGWPLQALRAQWTDTRRYCATPCARPWRWAAPTSSRWRCLGRRIRTGWC